ncbi:WD40-repeat-containing domain protein [Coprinopsis sp. MPI-PUGE-AT-0042]|nr:WD40-repeat-containing domain protein [Coprinopsis sp. MPI-PUGE-AT-0042]
MSRFLIGDDLGNVKVLRYSSHPNTSGSKITVKNVYKTESSLQGERRIGAQALATSSTDEGVMTLTAFSDGNLRLSKLSDDDSFEAVSSWTEPKLKTNRFVGVALTGSAAFSCTSNGALRMATYSQDSPESLIQHTRSLPMRLCDWKLSPGGSKFAYGGEEVALSVWDTEKAFQAASSSQSENLSDTKKRKRADALFPGEVWRAKHPSNDNLNLRQPTRITALNFLASSSSSSDLVAGNLAGDVQRYDTRSTRRPVAEWKSVGKDGVRSLVVGQNPHELFVGDNKNNLYSLDLRNGRTLYGYHGISGSVNCMASSAQALVSGSLDQYVRIHTMTPPPTNPKDRIESRGTIVDKHFLQCTPTCIAWDGQAPAQIDAEDDHLQDADSDDDGDDQDIWGTLETANDGDPEEEPRAKRRHTNSKKKST